MISSDLHNIADYVLGYAKRGTNMPVECSIQLAKVLFDLGTQVRAIEEIPLRLDSPEVRLGFHRLHEDHDAD